MGWLVSDRFLILAALCFMAFVLTGVGQAFADNAPSQGWMFHGDPEHTGAYDNGGVLWTFPTGMYVTSTPALYEGLIYVGSGDDNVYALNAATGTLIWKYKTGSAVDSSPAVVNGIVYIGSEDGNVYALNASTGSLLWNYTAHGITHSKWPSFPYDASYSPANVISSPAVVNGMVYVGSLDYNLYALDAATGSLVWNYTTGDAVVSSPAVDNGIVYVGSNDNTIYALNATSGTLIWKYLTQGGFGLSSPAVANDIVYAGVGTEVYAFSATSGELIWNYDTHYSDPFPSMTSPTVSDGTVFVGSSDSNIYALNANTGNVLWKYKTGGAVESSSPAVANGIVYAGSDDNNVYEINAVTGKLILKYSTNGSVRSSPTVGYGMIYVGSNDNSLYAISLAVPPTTGIVIPAPTPLMSIFMIALSIFLMLRKK